MKTKDEELQNFSEETLAEMGKENVEGGILDYVKFNMKDCPSINNCGTGSNCYQGNCTVDPI